MHHRRAHAEAERARAESLIGMMSGPDEMGDLMREHGRWFDEQASEADASKLVGSFPARARTTGL